MIRDRYFVAKLHAASSKIFTIFAFVFFAISAEAFASQNESFENVGFVKFETEKTLQGFLKENPEAKRLHKNLMWAEYQNSFSFSSELKNNRERLGIEALSNNETVYKLHTLNTLNKMEERIGFGREVFLPNPISNLDPDIWGLEKINVAEAWKTTTGSEDIIVALLDSGIARKHQALSRNIWVNESELKGKSSRDDDGNGYKDDLYGVDLIRKKSKDTLDDSGHGSHVAGIVAGYSEEAGFYGVAPNVKIMAVKTHNKDGNGSRKSVVKGVLYAVDNGADVINCSWGGAPEAEEVDQLLFDAIEYANQNGVVVVTSAGNRNVDNDEVDHYPSNYDLPNVIAVTSTDHYDGFSVFSNWGKKTVHLSAPGEHIKSAWTGYPSYRDRSGTSMAAPHVAGTVALIKSTERGSKLSPIEIRNLILENTARLDRPGYETMSNGRLDLSFLGDGTW
jgi:subtilisin family serine protease